MAKNCHSGERWDKRSAECSLASSPRGVSAKGANHLLPQGWSVASIADISIKGAQRKPSEEESFIYVDIGSINRDRKTIETPQKIMGKNAPSRARKSIKTGDVVVSLTRPNLNAVALINDGFDNQIASTGFEVIRPVLVESRLIFALVKSKDFIDSISGTVQGALYPAAKSSDVQAYQFPLPPLAEQKIIAEKLDTLLAQVEHTQARLQRIPDILKRFRQSVLADAVSGKLTQEWRELNQVSFIDWNVCELGDLTTVGTGSTPKKSEDKYWLNGDIPWLTSAATGDAFTYTANSFVTETAFKECHLKIYPEGTLLLAMYGEGKTRGQVTEMKLSATCNQACAAITITSNEALKDFIKLRLLENYEETRKAAAGGAQPNLNLQKVRQIPVSLPTVEEQTQIVARVEQLFAYADRIEQQAQAALERVNLLSQSILAKAFRGELTADWRAANPDLISGDNSAEALLAKIMAEKKSAKKSNKKA